MCVQTVQPVGDLSLGQAAVKQALLLRIAQKKIGRDIFEEAGSALVTSCSSTHPRFLHNTQTYSIGILELYRDSIGRVDVHIYFASSLLKSGTFAF